MTPPGFPGRCWQLYQLPFLARGVPLWLYSGRPSVWVKLIMTRVNPVLNCKNERLKLKGRYYRDEVCIRGL